MDNKNTRGYSEALGGFGVPQQVEATGGSNTASPRSRKSSGFKLGKPGMIAIVAVIVAAVLVWAFVAGPFAADKYKNYIEEIEKTTQDSGGVKTVNYLPMLKKEVDWAKLDQNTREGIARYAVGEILDSAKKDEVNSYQILGLAADRQAIFMYNKDTGKIQVYPGGQEAPVEIDAN